MLAKILSLAIRMLSTPCPASSDASAKAFAVLCNGRKSLSAANLLYMSHSLNSLKGFYRGLHTGLQKVAHIYLPHLVACAGRCNCYNLRAAAGQASVQFSGRLFFSDAS